MRSANYNNPGVGGCTPLLASGAALPLVPLVSFPFPSMDILLAVRGLLSPLGHISRLQPLFPLLLGTNILKKDSHANVGETSSGASPPAAWHPAQSCFWLEPFPGSPAESTAPLSPPISLFSFLFWRDAGLRWESCCVAQADLELMTVFLPPASQVGGVSSICHHTRLRMLMYECTQMHDVCWATCFSPS